MILEALSTLRSKLWLALPLGLLFVVAACGSSDTITSNDIVYHIPWSIPETDTYNVLDNNNKPVGTADFAISQSGSNLTLTQHYDFPSKGYVNNSSVLADALTLQPSTSSYKLNGPNGLITCDATYTPGQVSAHRVGQDGQRTDNVDIPAIAYDSWADLFLWRTINFSPGYEIDYADVLSCTLDNTQKIGVTLKVPQQEQVTVPAGNYQCWRLEIDSGGETQKAWYTTDAAHTLVKYDNGSETFELTKAGS